MSLTDTILTGTLVVVLWYAWETRLVRQEMVRQTREMIRQTQTTAKQTRVAIMPVLRVTFNRAPEKVFLENVGSGIAPRAWLRGFRFQSDDGRTWRCTFEPVAEMILPGKDVALRSDTEMEGVEPPQVYALESVVLEHLRRAMKGRERLDLSLYWTDLLANAYRAEVMIDRNRLYAFQERGRPNPATTLPPVEIEDFPDALDPM